MDIIVPITMAGVFVITVFGIIAGGGNLAGYIDATSLIITLGGGFNALVMASDMAIVKNLGKVVSAMLRADKTDVGQLIIMLISFAEKARREGLLVLEDDISDISDTFMKKGMQLVVDGTDPDLVRAIMSAEIDEIESRHDAVKKFFDDAAGLFPAWGMIGTLIGLVVMLGGLGGAGGSEMIGKGMAAALITTFYGSIMANGFAIPIAGKLVAKNSVEITVKNVMLEGILSVQAGDNPRIVKDKLIAYLPPSQRQKVNDSVN